MKPLLVILLSLFLVGCSNNPSMRTIHSYGEEKFIADVLAVADGNPTPERLRSSFRPLRVEVHLNGAWLVYKDSAEYQEGIYVDRESVDGWGGSGMEITRWSDKIGWSKEEVREKVER